jgi:hypothetical protein
MLIIGRFLRLTLGQGAVEGSRPKRGNNVRPKVLWGNFVGSPIPRFRLTTALGARPWAKLPGARSALARLGLALLLFRPDELDGADCFLVEVVAAGEVTIDRYIASDVATGDEERLHDEGSPIVDLA